MTISYPESESPLPQGISHRSVLIIDDDPQVRYVLKLLFESEDFEVAAEAADGANALALTLKHRPTFVVLDYQMPRMTGDKAAGFIRMVSPESKIIAFSAVLDRKPDWADAFLNKERISEVAPLLERLMPAAV